MTKNTYAIGSMIEEIIKEHGGEVTQLDPFKGAQVGHWVWQVQLKTNKSPCCYIILWLPLGIVEIRDFDYTPEEGWEHRVCPSKTPDGIQDWLKEELGFDKQEAAAYLANTDDDIPF